jgi:hypothetical protein
MPGEPQLGRVRAVEANAREGHEHARSSKLADDIIQVVEQRAEDRPRGIHQRLITWFSSGLDHAR